MNHADKIALLNVGRLNRHCRSRTNQNLVTRGARLVLMHLRSWIRLVTVAATGVLAAPSVASAGMPVLTLTEIASLRFEAISFFLLGFLVSAWIIQRLWNSVLRELARLPRLSYGKAIGLTTIWGLLFLLVLTMISGARELMTPGAWKKSGVTYKLAEDALPEHPLDHAKYVHRLEKLAMLRDALWQYARQHDGNLPLDAASSGLDDELWRVPDASRMDYLYFPGSISDGGTRIVVLEPAIFHDRQLAVTAGGGVGRLGDVELAFGPIERRD
jgi:hypothetical protein